METPCWACPLLSQPRHNPAAYIWTAKSGKEYPVCTECCARWRWHRWHHRHDNPRDMPARIRQI